MRLQDWPQFRRSIQPRFPQYIDRVTAPLYAGPRCQRPMPLLRSKIVLVLSEYGLNAVVLGALAFAGYAQEANRPKTHRVDYNTEVQPILSNNCYRCHGPDAGSRQAGLRLDQKESAYAQAVTPGKPDESEMMKRTTSQDPAYRMPPPAASAKSLTNAEVATLREWIQEGAEFQQHWSFVTPVKVQPPRVPAGGHAVNAIDRFILARLDQAGVKPSPQADKATLINRVTFSLTGLPPTLAEVDQFIADKDPNAYEKLVDRLLKSRAYGEHMAAYWMNIARYAESDGFLDDHHDRLFWPYRDWVINAFTKNMPFDQFSTWQLAGDLLPNPTKDQRLATAFLRVGQRTTENGAIDEEYRVEYALERANTVGAGFLALTVGCARCHDHKYDPIAQKDYYSLSGFFNSTDEPGFFSPGYSTVVGGPTLRWTDLATEQKIKAAEAAIRAAEASDLDARKSAFNIDSPKVDALLKQPKSAIAASVQESIDRVTDAYYPFETTAPVPDDQLPKLRDTKDPPPGLVTLTQKLIFSNMFATPPAGAPKQPSEASADIEKGPVAAQKAYGFRLPDGLIREKLVFSPSLTPGVAPAVLEESNLRPGIRGNALFFSDTNRGFLGKDVGWYERTRGFSLDLWIYAASVYPDNMVLNHRDDDNSGGGGYELKVENNQLAFYMMHSRPYNMTYVASKQPIPAKAWTHVAVTYDGSSQAAGIRIYVNGQPAELEVRKDNLTESILPRMLATAFNQFVGLEFGRRFRETTLKDGAIDELRLFNRALTPIEIAFLHGGPAALEINPSKLKAELSELVVANDPHVAESVKKLCDAREAENQIVSWVPEIMVMGDTPAPRPTYVLNRGLYNQHREEVTPRPLTQIFPFDDKLPRNRAGLAKWLFDPQNPLTARVFVNRIWQQQFGRGLVETSDDFGMQGSLPTHPELLDWLAVDFIESGWDIKRLNKMIVMSSTFQQSSYIPPDLLKKDPNNLLLARGPRLRMSAEEIRDNALAVSGLLVEKVGGPSVYPYQPDGVWAAGVTFYRYPKADSIPGEEQHRRSLYTFVKRNTPPPSMAVFDFSERHATSVRRQTSNTPLQALVLLNDPQYVEAYRAMAERALKLSADEDVQIKLIFRLATKRMPSQQELAALREFYQGETLRFAGEKKQANDLAHIGVTPPGRTTDVIHLAALTNVASAVMNSPEAYTIQ
jgi:mono/diheme cytochrome c family protein